MSHCQILYRTFATLLTFLFVMANWFVSDNAQVLSAAEPKLLYETFPEATEIDFGGRLSVDTSLTNQGKQPVTVYWGDYAYPDMYNFDIVHTSSQQRLPASREPVWYHHVPSAALKKHFRTLDPGDTVRYTLHLSGSHAANGQLVYFRRVGKHLIEPTLNVTTHQMLDPDSGEVVTDTNAWTGTLKAAPFTINVRAPTTSEKEGELRLNGMIVTEDNRPAAGAIVQLYQRGSSKGSKFAYRDQKIDQVYTNTNGRFDFKRVPDDSTSFRLMAWIPGHPVGSATIENDDTGDLDAGTITLPKGITLRGRIVDTKGKPLRDVRVLTQTRSGDDGRFAVVVPHDLKQIGVDFWRQGYVGISVKADRATATSGDWEIEMFTEASVCVRGRATFIDGKPLKNGRLVFKLELITKGEVPNRHWTEIRCETDHEGNFSVTLPANAEYKALVMGEADQRLASKRDWTATVASLSPASSPLEIVFQNRGSIIVNIAREKKLPDALTLVVNCLSGGGRVVATEKVTPNTDKVTFEELSPGPYSISVYLEQANNQRWSEEITVPDQEPFSVNADITIPNLGLGGVKARLLMPDGKLPAARTNVTIYSAGGSRRVITDDQGVFRAVDLLAGPVSFTPRDQSSGIAQVQYSGQEIEDRRITYLGNVRLKHIDEEFGSFEGVLQRDDGEPISSARVIGFYAGFDGNAVMVPDYFRQQQLTEDGAFQVRIPKGQQKVLFEFGSQFPYGGGYFSDFAQEVTRLVVDAEVEPGKTIKQKLILKRRTGGDRVTVTWDKDKLYPLLVASVQQAGFRWTSTVTNSEGSHTFRRVPAGPMRLMIRSYPTFFKVISISENELPPRIEIDTTTTSFAVKVVNHHQQPIKDLGISITARLGDELVYVLKVPTSSSDEHNTRNRHQGFEESADGTINIKGLTPGDYQVTISTDDWEHKLNTTVKPEGLTITLQVDTNGTLVSKSFE